MTNTPLLIDAEDVIGDYLRNHPDVSALTEQVMGIPPGDSQTPWVVVTQLDVADLGHGLEHLTEHMIQFDCFAGKQATTEYRAQAEANELAYTVRAALKDLQGQTLSGAVVTSVVFTGMIRLPDTTFEPARQCVHLTADITMHR